MAKRKWLLIFTTIMAVAQQIHAACVCKEKGEDGYATCSESIRPKPVHNKRPDFELPPIGDNCWCSKKVIQPAILPKTCPKLQKPSTPCKCKALSQPTSYLTPQVNYVQALVRDDSPPADPISIALAMQNNRAFEVPEAKLAYGFIRKPINSLPKVYISSIKEENLYAFANDVITLKKPSAPKTVRPEEDYPDPEEEEEEEEPASEYYDTRSLTYKQLGYEAEQFRNPEFIPVPPPAEEAAAEAEQKLDLGCGVKTGCVAKLRCIRKFISSNCSTNNNY